MLVMWQKTLKMKHFLGSFLTTPEGFFLDFMTH